MNIAICDDEKIFINDIIQTLDKISFQDEIDLYIDTFKCGEDLISAVKSTEKIYDLIFLDILMPTLNGIDTAKEIRTFNKDVAIVFLTSTIEYALTGYDVHALNYLLKPAKDDKIRNIIKNMEKYNKEAFFTLTHNHQVYKINLSNVNYFEVTNRTVHINTVVEDNLENIRFYKKLEDLKMELKEFNFVRCHRSYLINLNNVKAVSRTEVEFLNEVTAPVSRIHYTEVKKLFSDYLMESVI
ncbi:LytR/AlgR family response regulator transcription factor [Clostridium culturomicium]|uniref:LytR/AlgR family response regulator transcription factor n=1 Tax=Clostridium culturomicium TaxID=1499683 RepID=UPI00058FACE1|nr:LytTR family DNA-binding domain-containing protein [Clostridium culturomicium]